MMKRWITVFTLCAAVGAASACKGGDREIGQRSFPTPEDAVRSLTEAVKKNDLAEVIAIFGPDGQTLVDSSDPVTARQNRELFAVAVAEQWRLVDAGEYRKTLVVGNEAWPFPVPLVKVGDHWAFNTAAGAEEVIARRIGRNELAVIEICRTYVAAQRLYAARGHDGKRTGLYARQFRSEPGRQNGLYWDAGKHGKRSPLGELLTMAEIAPHADGARTEPLPFHGYFFRILTAQGPAAPGGAKDYVVGDDMPGGFALVAWPAHYDVTGVMTFIVNHDGRVHERDLGPSTEDAVRVLHTYDPDSSWSALP
jgi:DUF2950 family protein